MYCTALYNALMYYAALYYPALDCTDPSCTAFCLTGDAFIGGFITGWSQGWSDVVCMKLGTSVAAAKLSKIGAREGLPTPLEVNRRLAKFIGIA